MLKITKEISEQLRGYSAAKAPVEACGYLSGNGENIIKFYPMTNMDNSTDHFTLEPKEQLKVIKETRSEGLEVKAVFHSHPVSPARPSVEDIKLAYDPNIVYVIGSLKDQKWDLKGYRIKQGKVTEEELIVSG